MKLKEFRLKNNLTQNQVGKLINKTATGYNYYESGKSEPDIKSLIILSQYYHTTIDELVGLETNMINLNALEPEMSTIIKKLLNMNNIQKQQTYTFINALTMFDN